MKSFAPPVTTTARSKDPSHSVLRRVLAKLETPSLRAEDVQYAPGFCMARHSEPFSFLACTLAGTHWSANNYGGHVCLPGSVRFLPASEPHETYFANPTRCLLIKLREPLLKCASQYGTIPGRPGQLEMAATATFSRLLHSELSRQDAFSAVAIEGLALELLLTAKPELLGPPTPIPAWLRHVCELLHDEPERRPSLAELARRVERHPVQVCRQFHRRFRCTIGEYVRRIRVGRAQALLVSRDLPVAEIALACGFADQSQLTAAFRRLTGLPPGRYRRRFAPFPVSS